MLFPFVQIGGKVGVARNPPYIQEVYSSLQEKRALRLQSSESSPLASSVTEKWLERGKVYVCVSVYVIHRKQVQVWLCARCLHQLTGVFILFYNCPRGSLYCIVPISA